MFDLETVSAYEPPVETSSELHMNKPTHDMFARLLKEAQAKGMGRVGQKCRVFRRHLHKDLRHRLSTQRVLDAVRVAVIEANGGHPCACCAFDRLLEEAKFDPEIYGCTHIHQDASPDLDVPVESPIRRVATAMARPNPNSYAAARQRAAYPYAYGYTSGSDSDSSRASPSPSGYASSSSSSSSSESDNGRVSKTKRAARASPYARPAAAPRSRSVEVLAERVAAVDLAADSDVDAVTGSLKRVAIADNGYYVYSPPSGYTYCPQPQQPAVRTSSWPCTMADYCQTNRL